MILGFDPGRDKCGVAIMDGERSILYHQIIDSAQAVAVLQQLCRQFNVKLVVMGDRTTAKTWRNSLTSGLPSTISIEMVDENNSTLEARDRYWKMYPPQGLQRLIPQGMRLPPRPVDDIVAILLIERYLAQI
jgi:RNase H-fold protein (predicted Holliday junction resolvase)